MYVLLIDINFFLLTFYSLFIFRLKALYQSTSIYLQSIEIPSRFSLSPFFFFSTRKGSNSR